MARHTRVRDSDLPGTAGSAPGSTEHSGGFAYPATKRRASLRADRPILVAAADHLRFGSAEVDALVGQMDPTRGVRRFGVNRFHPSADVVALVVVDDAAHLVHPAGRVDDRRRQDFVGNRRCAAPTHSA